MHPVVLRMLKLLRGGRGARHVVPAVVFGALAGATCGWNLTFAAVLTAALLINGPLGATLVAATIALVVTHAASHLMQTLGGFCLEKLGLGTIVESLGHGPFVSMLGWDDYELVGGAMLALCASLPAAHALGRRAGQAVSASCKTERLLRPYCVPLGATCAVLLFVLPSAVGPRLVGEAVLKQWSAVVGAPVTAENIAYNLSTGDLQLSQVRVHGVAEPGRVLLRIEHAKFRVEPGLLLRGCLHCDEALLSGIECDTPPTTPAMPLPTEPTVLREDTPAGARAAAQPIDVARFVRDWSDVEGRLGLLGALIGSVETVADLETQQTAATRLESARRRRTAPLDALSGKMLPLVQIKRLKIEVLPETWALGSDASLELLNLTSRPGATARTTQLTMDAPTYRGRVVVAFRFTGADRRHDLTTTWDSGSAASIVDARRAAGAGIDVAYAQLVSLRGQGWITREALDVPLACEMRGVVPAANCGRFGEVDGSVWHAGITRLGGLRFDLGLAGRLRDAKLQVVPSSMVVQLKHQLRAAGEHQLVKSVESGRLIYNAPAPIVAAATPAPTSPATPSSALPTTLPPAPSVAAAPKVVAPAVVTPAVVAPAANMPGALNLAANNAASPISVTVDPTKQPTAAMVAAVTPAVSPAPTPTPEVAPTVAKPTVAASAPIAAASTPTPPATTDAAVSPTVTATTPRVTSPPITTPIPTPTPPAVVKSSHLPAAQPPTPALATSTATPTVTATPSTAATIPPANYGPSGVSVPQPSPTQGLRQPASVATTSAGPSAVEWNAANAQRQSFATSTTPAPQVAANPRTLTNIPQPSSAARASSDPRSRLAPQPQSAPQSQPAPQLEEAKPSIFSRVGGWFGTSDEQLTSAPKVAQAPAPRQPAPTIAPPNVTASKPMFPRLRSMFAEESESDIAATTVPPIAERSSTIPRDTQPNSPATVETAEKPWYERVFR